MKKYLLALLVSVFSLTIVAGLTTKSVQAADKYDWLTQYETDGYRVLYQRDKRENFATYGYSGVDILLGDKYVYPVAKGNVLTPGKDMAVPTQGWGSFSVLYYNNTDKPWVVSRLLEPAYFLMTVDANGKVLQIDNAYHKLTVEGAEEGVFYDVWWDAENNTIATKGGAYLGHKPNESVHLKYGDLANYQWLTKKEVDDNTEAGVTFADTDLLYLKGGKYVNYINVTSVQIDAAPINIVEGEETKGNTYGNLSETTTPTKAAIDTDKADGVTFAAGDKVYLSGGKYTNVAPKVNATYGQLTEVTTPKKSEVDASLVDKVAFKAGDRVFKTTDGKYTNVAITPVMNDEKGFVVPAGGFVFALEYLDNIDFNTDDKPFIRSFAQFVNGQDEVVKIAEHDITAPVISAKDAEDKAFALSGIKQHKEGSPFVMPTVVAEDLGLLLTAGDETNPEVTTTIFKYDRARKTYDAFVADPTIPEGMDYLVEAGMWGSKIATKFETTLARLEELNPGINWDNLQAGHTIKVPNPDYVAPVSTEVEEITTNLVGDRFKVVHTATDGEGNKATATYEVHIIGDFAPQILGVGNKSVAMGGTIDLKAGVTATDGYGFDITENIKVISFVDTSKAGNYIVIYTVKNAYNLEATEFATVSVLDAEAPRVLPITDVVIAEGTDFDLTSVVVAFDNLDQPEDLLVTKVSDDFFDKNTPGKYEIKLLVSDAAGNESEVKYFVTVVATEDLVDSKFDDVDGKLEDLEGKDGEIKTSLDSKVAELQGKLDSLNDDLSSKDSQLMVISIIAGVLALGGIGLGIPALLKKQ